MPQATSGADCRVRIDKEHFPAAAHHVTVLHGPDSRRRSNARDDSPVGSRETRRLHGFGHFAAAYGLRKGRMDTGRASNSCSSSVVHTPGLGVVPVLCSGGQYCNSFVDLNAPMYQPTIPGTVLHRMTGFHVHARHYKKLLKS